MRLFYLKVSKEFLEPSPRVTFFVTPPIEPFEQDALDLVEELFEADRVAEHAKVVVIPTEFGVQLFEQIGHALSTFHLTPGRELFE